ncbi:MAG TPA: hypothetical protein DD435_06525 [Cyanobacteria bacterium UBA8530]|nr:hypothetical protein [Cyanobacteria bacterium UBA8530]
MFKRTLSLGLVCLAIVGCGTAANSPSLKTGLNGTTTLEADATNTLKKGFKALHKAIFAKIDANHDRFIDEYEAGANISLKDMANMDKNHDGKISYTTFIEYATKTTFLGYIPWFPDTDLKFMKRIREDLQWVFRKMDTNGSWLLEPAELSTAAQKRIALGFSYDNLRLKLNWDAFTPDEMKTADKTGDGNLSQAEFEDLYLNKVISLLNPAAVNPDPAPSPAIQAKK